MYQYWFNNGDKCALKMKDTNNRGSWVWGTWELFVPHNFFVTLK